MRLLITNDDGIYSPGILALAKAARNFGSVRIVAPDVERSASSHSITSSRPLTYRATEIEDFEAYRVNGTPADCVAMGCYHWEEADVILSGINLGPNIGNALWHSGTLAAAKQGTLLGLRGIALSTPVERSQPNFERLEPYLEDVLDLLLNKVSLPLVNVNFPVEPKKGLRWTRQSVRHYDGKIMPGTDPMGREHFWFTVQPIEATGEDTDRWAVEQGYVSMTPLRIDLTSEEELEAVQEEEFAGVA